jgi:hypothetical protein
MALAVDRQPQRALVGCSRIIKDNAGGFSVPICPVACHFDVSSVPIFDDCIKMEQQSVTSGAGDHRVSWTMINGIDDGR